MLSIAFVIIVLPSLLKSALAPTPILAERIDNTLADLFASASAPAASSVVFVIICSFLSVFLPPFST